ncbi:hypothetical protein V500_03298 [Pseudogymnoascus sp. VKM F-4518 (FW-2643)]|nr:hypothetical protein V500_03298 [Pseudogymnoascus sp. VKM F-4518 (FW-2643)]
MDSTQPSKSNKDEEADWDKPPPYSAVFSGSAGAISAAIQDDGRVDVRIDTKEGNHASLPPLPPSYTDSQETLVNQYAKSPPLNIVIQIVGSRGDVQPFIALGQELQASGHRIRIATHPEFKDFVESSSLEFFSIGGDPAGLIAYMVKNPSIIPTFNTLVSGDIGRKRKMIYVMLNGCWESCVMPDATSGKPFVADAIIANPPSFAHVHWAQALGVPLHLMFTMPWSPTREFPHPLANMQNGQTNPQTANYLSYGLVDIITWQGLSDVINMWRRKVLNLEAVPAMAGPSLAEALKVPFTYCWSPALIPKPRDWPSYIDVCGFFFRQEKPYTPDKEAGRFSFGGSKANLHWLWQMAIQTRISAIVPFFGDQPFWANMVAAAGAGPRPIAYRALNVPKLSAAIRMCLAPETANAVKSIAARMRHENGVKEAAQSFHRNLPIETMKCDIMEGENAIWLWNKKGKVIKMSDRAAFLLLRSKKINAKDLEMYKPKPTQIENPRWEPLTATSSALIGSMVDFSTAIWGTFANPVAAYKAGRAGGGQSQSVGKSFGRGVVDIGGTVGKAALVDVPLALTDGLREVPKLYGGTVRRHGPVTDWKSGGVVAGKSFGYGFYDGITGFVTQPMAGAKKDGALGFTKGFAKGSLELFTKPGAAMFGLMAYPTMGLYKSMNSGKLSPTDAQILQARQMLSVYVNEQKGVQEDEVGRAQSIFGLKAKN